MTAKLKKIGIPRAFFFHSYPGLFETFFRAIGIEPVVSAPSTKDTLQRAMDVCETEHCLPNKLFDGHVATLLDHVDAVFIPRMISLTKGHIACPRFGALPEATRSWIGPTKQVISMEINETNKTFKKSLVQLGCDMGVSKSMATKAATTAFDEYLRQQKKISQKNVPSNMYNAKRFLVLGHPYTLRDRFISRPILQKLDTLNVPIELISFDDPISAPTDILWCTFAKMYNRLVSLEPVNYAGVIQMTTFNCGCDSMMMERFGRLCKKRGIPYMILMVDEHTGRAGIETRLEAFVDSIAWRERKNNR